MPNQLAALLTTIDANKATLDAARPLPTHTVASLREKLMLEWTYHSNAIEGNTLTLRETKVVLEGITVGGKSLREHFEATNHRDAILYVEEIVAKHELLAEWQIRNLHALVLKSIDSANAGRYRQENVVIAGASMTPPGLHASSGGNGRAGRLVRACGGDAFWLRSTRPSVGKFRRRALA